MGGYWCAQFAEQWKKAGEVLGSLILILLVNKREK